MHLRRHIATMSQIVNLESNGLENLATFLGHDINVHREYYRLPENTYQLAKCTKMLIAAKRGMGHFSNLVIRNEMPYPLFFWKFDIFVQYLTSLQIANSLAKNGGGWGDSIES